MLKLAAVAAVTFLAFLLPFISCSSYESTIHLVSQKMLNNTSSSSGAFRMLKPKPKPVRVIDTCTNLVAYELGWTNWQEFVQTNLAVFRPKNDKELKNILKAARTNDCTVRVSGATASSDGLVVQRREINTVIVSLADYQTSSLSWQDKIFTDTKRVRIGAGRSFYDLTKLIRPSGFLLPTRTAGRYFTIGGVVANMVHGGGKNSGFIHEDVTGLLVMLANGNIMEITEEDELKYWRSSAGLLGIILAVEFQLLEDTGFQMQLEVKTYDTSANDFFSTFVTDVFTAVAMNDHIEFFFNPYDGELLILGANMFGTPPDASRLEAYRLAADNLVNANLANDISYNGPPTFPLTSPCDIIPEPFCFDSQASAYIMAGAVHDILSSGWMTTASTVNDGYYSDSVSQFHSVDTFAPASTFPQMLGQFLGLFQAFSQSGSSVYYPSSGLQFRFVNPTSKQGVLSPVPPIADLEAEFLANNFFPLPAQPGSPSGYVALHYTGFTNINDEHADIFLQQLESLFRNTPLDPSSPVGPGNPLIPVKAVHFGKQWGFGLSPSPGMKHIYYPYSDSNILSETYSFGKSSALSDFNTKRLELDPNGLFAGGSLMRWLDSTNYPLAYFEPRALDGQSCYDVNVIYQDTACLSGCCGATTMQCVGSGLSTGSECQDSCQCLSNTCEVEIKSKPAPKNKPAPKMKCA